MSKPFKFGEKVIVLKAYGNWPEEAPKNRKGRVWQHDRGDDIIGIRFDENVGGHDIHTPGEDVPLGAHCKHGHGWFVEREFVSRIKSKRRST